MADKRIEDFDTLVTLSGALLLLVADDDNDETYNTTITNLVNYIASVFENTEGYVDWSNLNQELKSTIAMKLGIGYVATDSTMFNTHTEPNKVYFGTYTNGVHYHFFTIKDFNDVLKAQYRFSVNGIEKRDYDPENTACSSWSNIRSGVTQNDLENGAVTSGKLASGAVTSGKIASGAVTSGKIGNGEVKQANLANSSVTDSAINNGAVTGEKIADGAVATGKLAASAVTTEKIADAAITEAKISNTSISTAKLKDAAVTSDKLSSDLASNLSDVNTALNGASGLMSYKNLETISEASALDGINRIGNRVWEFIATGSLASAIGITNPSHCSMTAVFCDGTWYQIITVLPSLAQYVRKVNTVYPNWSADSWVSSSLLTRISALENTVGTLNDQLETALNGGGS